MSETPNPDVLRTYAQIFLKPRREHSEAPLMPPTELQVAAADSLNFQADVLDGKHRVNDSAVLGALVMGMQLAVSGGHGAGDKCPTCHFLRETRKALAVAL